MGIQFFLLRSTLFRCRVTRDNDLRTQEMAALVAEHLHGLTGLSPTTVYSDLHRSKLDPNRAEPEATLNVSQALAAYRAYHACIQEAVQRIQESGHGYGIVVDIHGHGHPMNWTEIGVYDLFFFICSINEVIWLWVSRTWKIA